jgi:hypothetical protein
MSDFGSELGAKRHVQRRSAWAYLASHSVLTCSDVNDKHVCTSVCSVRIEGVRGSNPLSSTHVVSRDIGDI